MLGCRFAIPALLERGGGAIVNTASAAAFYGSHSLAAYGISKAGSSRSPDTSRPRTANAGSGATRSRRASSSTATRRPALADRWATVSAATASAT